MSSSGHRGTENRLRNPVAVLSSFLLLGMLAGGGGGSTTGVKKGPPPPQQIVLTVVGPYNVLDSGNNWVPAGTAQFMLDTGGTGFTSTSVVEWNGSALASQFGSSVSLDATVPASLVASPGTAAISVYDPASGLSSGTLPFGIASPAAATAGVVQLITVAPDGSPANQDSLVAPSISNTGRYVSFQSAATNLGAGPSSAYQQIYERDTCIGAPSGCKPSTIPISVTYDGSTVNGHSRYSSISGDGRYVAFDSSATNIMSNTDVCGGVPSPSCVFIRDTCIGSQVGCTPSTALITIAADGSAAGGQGPKVSPDGRFVTFNSSSANVADGNPDTEPNVFTRDTCNGAPLGCIPKTEIASLSTAGEIGNLGSFSQAVNATGRFVAFQSYATNLIPNNTSIYNDIYLRDTCIGAPASCVPSTTRQDVSSSGAQSNAPLDFEVVPSISADGRFIAYASNATNLVPQNVNGQGQIYLRDTCFGAAAACSPSTTLVSIGNDGSIPNAGANNQSMSADGRFVAFASLASNLVPGDTFPAQGWKDIFVRDTCFGAPTGCKPITVRVSVADTPVFATQSNAINDFPQISGDGHYVVFMSSATNYLAAGGNGNLMVYLAKTGF